MTTTGSSAGQSAISLFSALAVQGALDDVILPAFRAEYDAGIDITYDPTTVLVNLIRDGARPDVLIAVTDAVYDLVDSGAIDVSTILPIVKVGVGVAVASGASAPDISTKESLTRALLGARSVAYSRAGASGIYFAELLETLGVADDVNAHATVVDKGFTALAVVDGRADLAIQQLSELKFVPGVDIVGPLPEEVQRYTEFSAALSGAATEKSTAVQLLRVLAAESSNDAYLSAGLQRP
jgi:ABC-type molybdate transport system substrate-binding protein